MTDHSDIRTATWLALLLLSIYLLTFGGSIYSSDGWSMFAVTESFVKRGELGADQMWTLFRVKAEPGRDGEAYAKYGYGTSLFAAPFYTLALLLPNVGLIPVTLFSSAFAVAVGGAWLYLTARRLNYSRAVSATLTLMLGLATPAWVYAKEFWSEPFALLTLVGAFYFVLRFRSEFRLHDALFGALALALAIAVRTANAALFPFFALYAFDRVLTESRTRRAFILFAFIVGLGVLSVGAYNVVRYADPLMSGYRADETFSNPIGLGLYGLLFSPGKGLFLYAPFLSALPATMLVFYRRARREFWLMLACIGASLITFATWYYWWGGTNWGPRFLVPLLPFFVLLTAPAVEFCFSISGAHRRAFIVVFAALVLVSAGIELLGISVSSLTYRLHMLAVSNNAEADAIFSPAFSPLVGDLGVIKWKNLNFAWVHVTDRGIEFDWLWLTFVSSFVIFCALMLIAEIRKRKARMWTLPVAWILSLALMGFVMYRTNLDAQSGYRALLDTLRREAQPRDVLVLNDDARAPIFFNANRTIMRWYGLSRDPARFDRSLLERLERDYARVWFAFDDSTDSLPDPVQDWLGQSLQMNRMYEFGDGVQLGLFTTGTQP